MPKEQSARRHNDRAPLNATGVLPSPASARQSRGSAMAKVQDLADHHARAHQNEDRRTDAWRQSKKTVDTGKFVTVSELADYWHVSERSIYRHILKGALPVVRIGPFGRLRIRTRDALSYGRADSRN